MSWTPGPWYMTETGEVTVVGSARLIEPGSIDARVIEVASEMAALLERVVENANEVAVCPGCLSVQRHLPGCRIVEGRALLSRIRGEA